MLNPLHKQLKTRGLGDVVARVAQPIAKAIDAVAGTNIQNCGGCKKRQQSLNQKFPMKTLAILLLSSLSCFGLDWTYSTNLYNNLSYPTNIYMGTNATDGATNGDTFYQWGTKINGFMLTYNRDKANQSTTNSYVATNLPSGLTTNLQVLVAGGTTNTLYFTNGLLKVVN